MKAPQTNHRDEADFLETASFIEQHPLQFRSHDSRLGYFYEVRWDHDYHRLLFVYRHRADALGRPVFVSEVNIFSAFHTPDEKFFVVNHGSCGYGNVAIVFRRASPDERPYISEADFRGIMDAGLKNIYPELEDGALYHLYAPIRDIRDGTALIYASGDFIFESVDGKMRQEQFKGVFVALNLEKRVIIPLAQQDGLKSWYRGLPNSDAAYGSGCFITKQHILTNAHVVADAHRVVVGLGNKETWGEVIAVSKEFDFALIVIAPKSLLGVPLVLASSAPQLGQQVRAYGYPLPPIQGYTLKATDGIISGLFGLHDDPLHFQFTAPIQPGNSGGALLNEENELLGITVASIDKLSIAEATGVLPENVNLGIHLDVIRRFLGDHHVSMEPLGEALTFDPEQSCVQISSIQSNQGN